MATKKTRKRKINKNNHAKARWSASVIVTDVYEERTRRSYVKVEGQVKADGRIVTTLADEGTHRLDTMKRTLLALAATIG